MKRIIVALALLACVAPCRADDALQAGFGEADTMDAEPNC